MASVDDYFSQLKLGQRVAGERGLDTPHHHKARSPDGVELLRKTARTQEIAKHPADTATPFANMDVRHRFSGTSKATSTIVAGRDLEIWRVIIESKRSAIERQGLP